MVCQKLFRKELEKLGLKNNAFQERREREKKEREREKKKERIARQKREGTYMTAAQKEKARMDQIKLEGLKAQGLVFSHLKFVKILFNTNQWEFLAKRLLVNNFVIDKSYSVVVNQFVLV